VLVRNRDGFPMVTVVTLFFKNGNIYDVRCPREEDTLSFHRSLKALWSQKYTKEEIEERRLAVHVRPSSTAFPCSSLTRCSYSLSVTQPCAC